MPKAIAVTEAARDRIWRQQDDARTLANADEILKDKGRLSGARKQAKVMVKEQEDQLTSLKKISKQPVTKKK